jgi:hypothetical protein
MIIDNPYELFVLLLSNARQDTECTTQTFQDFNKIAQNDDVKEALNALSIRFPARGQKAR